MGLSRTVMLPVPVVSICAVLGFCSLPANITDATMQRGSNMTANATTVAVKNHAKPPLNTTSLVNARTPTGNTTETVEYFPTCSATKWDRELHNWNLRMQWRRNMCKRIPSTSKDHAKAPLPKPQTPLVMHPAPLSRDKEIKADDISAGAFDWIYPMVSVWASRAKAAWDSLLNDTRIAILTLLIMFAYNKYAEYGISKEHNVREEVSISSIRLFLLHVQTAMLNNKLYVLQEEVSILRMFHNSHRGLRAEPVLMDAADDSVAEAPAADDSDMLRRLRALRNLISSRPTRTV